MRNTLAFLAALALTVAAAGWYLGWYHVRATPSRAGHESVTVDVNTDKVGQDLHNGKAKVEELLQKKGLTGPAGKDGSAPVVPMPHGLSEEAEPPARAR